MKILTISKGQLFILRSRGPDGEIYMINSTDTANAGPYVVEYESGHGNISAIKNNLVLKSGSKDYFTNKQIEAFMKTFFKYDFCLLGVDSFGNVIVNPFRANEPVFFLRLKETTNEKIVRKGYVYSHYKDNWYINNHKL